MTLRTDPTTSVERDATLIFPTLRFAMRNYQGEVVECRVTVTAIENATKANIQQNERIEAFHRLRSQIEAEASRLHVLGQSPVVVQCIPNRRD